ncbi:MAG: hypothetical protein QXL17_00660 [Candidatus Thermoplasmatota archaeon]
MSGKISSFLRELVAPFSIFFVILGIIFMVFGIIWIFFKDLATNTSSPVYFLSSVGEWNWYVLAGGVLLFGIGLYYLYSFLSKRHFVLKELKTNKRSELLKRHAELKAKVKRLPKKYQRMLAEKEEELQIE